MITDANLPPRSLISRPLKRGRACMNCRFLKIKCDGVKPICGPCRKHPKDDECEYSDGPARSRTKALEDTVQRLEARLHELEHPEDSTPSVTLFDPYSPYPPPPPPAHPLHPHALGGIGGPRSLPNTPYGALPRLLTPGGSLSSSSPESQCHAPLSPFSPPSSTPPFGPHGSSPLGIFDSRVQSAATPDSSSSSSLEFDPQLCDALIQTFLPHAAQFGLFLDPQRFLFPSSPGSPATPVSSRTAPALLYTLCTWGAHLRSDPVREESFRFRALQSLSTELSAHPQTLLQSLQAEVLLGYYFWRTGKLLKARVHSASATALVLGSGLNHVRAAHPGDAGPVLDLGDAAAYAEHQYSYAGAGAGAGTEVRLLPPADALEEGERIAGFWAAFALQKALAAALATPNLGTGAGMDAGVFEASGVQIDTPWPREIAEYRQGLVSADARGEATVKRYLSATNLSSSPSYHQYDHDNSLAAMLVKAHILFHRAVYMQGQWTPGVSQREQQALTAAFHSIGNLIDTLRAQLPPRHAHAASPAYSQSSSSYSQSSSAYSQSHSQSHSPSYSQTPSPAHDYEQPDGRVCLTHALLDGAAMRLHAMFMYADAGSRARCVQSAMDMLRDAPSHGAEVSPIMGTLWASACSMLAAEMKHVRQTQTQTQAQGGAWPAPAESEQARYDYEHEKDVSACLNDGLAALQAGARESAMMRPGRGRGGDMTAPVRRSDGQVRYLICLMVHLRGPAFDSSARTQDTPDACSLDACTLVLLHTVPHLNSARFKSSPPRNRTRCYLGSIA
ncbi:hypothetical protein GGX14DRAFT_545978 [Mycena pura]|uniref:Zn(2)-C6 fungal-type domain-containing protein n=1 Tax=Mycena pura TaxID=153505 RepID=A0AAD6V1A0_9AGAR|nr:hypothetical protein GGX14DRAFT_545978 [Mycena pura]